jgi:hypothetical protein
VTNNPLFYLEPRSLLPWQTIRYSILNPGVYFRGKQSVILSTMKYTAVLIIKRNVK